MKCISLPQLQNLLERVTDTTGVQIVEEALEFTYEEYFGIDNQDKVREGVYYWEENDLRVSFIIDTDKGTYLEMDFYVGAIKTN